ncbi:MAG: hypothetical protein JXA74_13280 [Anaerolineae bacterium]|nr:hypothetical protein [Anaerolineae bacterium]
MIWALASCRRRMIPGSTRSMLVFSSQSLALPTPWPFSQVSSALPPVGGFI